jgi:signal transduction histidine kinase
MGTMLLTLLTVSAVGVVALLIMQRYMVQQERASMTANAQAIAKQAIDFMTPVQVAPRLQQLAQTAAFFGDISVRIVDSVQMPLADSAVLAPYPASATIATSPIYFQFAPPPEVAAGAVPVYAPNMVWTMGTQEITVEATQAQPASGSYRGQETSVIVVQKSPSIWGDRLVFNAEAEAISTTMPVAAAGPIVYAVNHYNYIPPGAMSDPVSGGVVGEVSSKASGEVIMAQPIPVVKELGVSAVVAKGDVLETEKKLAWEKEKRLEWEKKMSAAPGAIVQPTLLQSAGFQSTDFVTVPIQSAGTTLGFVELGRMADRVDEPLGAIRRSLGIAAGASALLAIAVGLVMSRTLTSPIQNLAQAAAAMSSGDLTARAPVVGRDELASLARQFNQMADALHRSFVELAAERDTLRRFVADASHELRTPITALRTFNELLQGPAQADQEARAEFLAESHAQIARLEWITRNLLDLSRWDGGMATLTLAEAEVGELVIAAAAPFRAVAQERQIALNVVVPATPVVANVDERRLGMAVGNLLDNALKFTPSQGKVEVGVSQDGQGVKIWISDTGMGIGAEELPHIFERFYRSPRATQAGSGLGLAIVERIVYAHGATIHVESEKGLGSRFIVCMGV